MSTVATALDQQRRIQELGYDWTGHPQVREISQVSGLSPRRTAGLLGVASVVGAQSMDCALRSVASAARWAGGNPVAAMKALHRDLPITSSRPRRQQFGDGTLVKITMETWAASPTLLQGPGRVLPDGRIVSDHDRRERVANWSVSPTARVYWAHQRDRHNADLRTVGRIVAGEADAVTRDLRLWVELTDPDMVERALFRDLSASPGLAADGQLDRGFSDRDQEHTRTWQCADVVEMSLVPFGRAALGGVTVELSMGAPSTASTPTTPRITSWDEPRSARALPVSDPAPVGPVAAVRGWTTKTPSGSTMSWRAMSVRR